MHENIKSGGAVAAMVREKTTDREILEGPNLPVSVRPPTDKDWAAIQQSIAVSADKRQAALEAIFRALLCSEDFYFNHQAAKVLTGRHPQQPPPQTPRLQDPE